MIKVTMILAVALACCFANPLPQDGKFGVDVTKNMGAHPNLNIYGQHEWSNDRGSLGLTGNHNRELGGLNRHQTNAGVQGKYDVYRSDDGKTTGTVFGRANQQWNSHGPDVRGYEYGGRVQHTWGK